MKKDLCVVVIGILLTLPGGFAYSQEREPENQFRTMFAWSRTCGCTKFARTMT